ncbi:MAG: hypothetical protein HYZ54_05600 [Ignavibacteriae bacterium]|nr:hypothetical protein [Ignavibacteriota bacterium]
MKAFIGLRLAIAICISLWTLGCSESTTTSNEPQIQIYTQLDATSVTPASKSNGEPAITVNGETADSLHINRVRILISNMKLHMTKEDSNFPGHDIKVGPFLLNIDASGAYLNASSPIPIGIYDHIKFEIHKFSANEVGAYLNDGVYSDFVTDDRYTIIIEGISYKDGVGHPFTYKSKSTHNLTLKFLNDIDIQVHTTYSILLFMNPLFIFRNDNSVLDPRDPNNSDEIEKGIKLAFRALKRL